ncbi:MAG TPA: biopolymer transporter ExbD [Gammaproteobacteria bacterium]|jgi:biopolymer transport protein ExbD|nr:biopolymer transporter ExbD [Gammaproteobacteria bacterium]
MQSRRHAPETEETGIDLAPMLDFTTNLLIFFIITTSFIKEAGTVVTKPTAETAFGRESGNLMIAIRDNGDIWIDRKRVEMRDVRPIMERLHIERPDDTVVIIADKGSTSGVVAEVMDEVRLAGIQIMSIAADPAS